jgi:paraquat-inducible protein A
MPASNAIPATPSESDRSTDGSTSEAEGDSRPVVLESYEDLTACEECDIVYRKREIACDELARCPRCGAVVERGHKLGLEGQLALSVAALMVFMMANSFPIITLDLRGVHSEATMAGALIETWNLQQRLVAAIAGFTAVLAPLLVILLRLYVAGSLAASRVPAGFGVAMQALRYSTRWSMVEVFMLGTLVSIVRVAGLASVIPGIGIFSFGVLTLLLASIEAAGMHKLWECAGSLRARDRSP